MATSKTKVSSSNSTMVTSKVRKFMTIEQLEEVEKGPVYVINATSGELGGNLLFSVPKLNGNGHDLIRVPKTFIPIDLSMQVSRQQLVASSEFRSTVNKGLIKIASREYAKALLESEDGQAEQTRIQNEMKAARMVVENAVVQEETDDDYIEVKQVEKEAKASAASDVNTVSIKLKTLVNNAKHEEWVQTKTVLALRNYGSMSKKDVSYLSKQFKDSPRIRKYLQEVAKENGYL
jgi:hypothetical protein